MKQKILISLTALGLTLSPTISFAVANQDTNASPKTSNVKSQTGAIEIILKDHQHIRQLIAELNKELSSNPEKSHATYNQLKDLLQKHETMEQKIWYPELEKNEKLKPIINALIKEENDAGTQIKKIDDTKDEKTWVLEVKKLIKAVEHHAKEEETKLFPKVKQTLDKATLDAIGEKLKAYQSENNIKY